MFVVLETFCAKMCNLLCPDEFHIPATAGERRTYYSAVPGTIGVFLLYSTILPSYIRPITH